VGELGDAVLNGVFDHGLEDERGDLGGVEVGGDVYGELEAVGEADLLDVEVGLGEGELLFEGDLLAGGLVEHVTEEVAEAGDHGEGGFFAAFAHETGDGVEGVEEEVGFDLLAEGVELGFGELLVEARGFGLLLDEAGTGVEDRADDEDDGIEEGEEEYLAEESMEEEGSIGAFRQLAPGIEAELEPDCPGGEDEADGETGGEVGEPGGDAAGVELVGEAKDEGSGESPGHPVKDGGEVDTGPGVVHAFGTHDEEFLGGVDESEGEPDGEGGDPAGCGPGLVRRHREIVDEMGPGWGNLQRVAVGLQGVVWF